MQYLMRMRLTFKAVGERESHQDWNGEFDFVEWLKCTYEALCGLLLLFEQTSAEDAAQTWLLSVFPFLFSCS